MPVGKKSTRQFSRAQLLPVDDGIGKMVRRSNLKCVRLCGSDFVMLFQAGYDFALDSPRNNNQGYSHLLMGERVGRLQRLPAAGH